MNCYVNVGGRSVEVYFSSGVLEKNIDLKKIIDFKPFQDYCRNMDSRFIVLRIIIESVVMFGDRVGFIKLTSGIVNEEGKFIPGTAFLRGGSVVILVILNDEDGKKYVVMVRQPRSPVGRFDLLEMVAGMIDGSNNFAAKAVEEIREELEIDIAEAKLTDLTKLIYGEEYPGIYATAGGSDEFFVIMSCEINVSKDDIKKYNNKKTGVSGEGEMIVTEVVLFEEVWRKSPTATTLAALMLYKSINDRR